MKNIYAGYYKSADDKMLAGVCSGLAHKMNLNVTGLRFVFFIAAFCWVGLIVYICLWLVLKSAPTLNIQPPA